MVKYYGFILPNRIKSSSTRQISASKAVDIFAASNPSVYGLKGERGSPRPV